MKKYFILAILATSAIIFFMQSGSANNKENVYVETRKIESKLDIPIVDLRDSQQTFPSGTEKAVETIVNNINNMDGWSLTGYAKLSLDSEFKMQRWKFGIINAETYDFDTQLYYRKNNLFTEYDHEPQSIIFGIAFNKEF